MEMTMAKVVKKIAKKASKKAANKIAKKASKVEYVRHDATFDTSKLDTNWSAKKVADVRAVHHGVRVRGKDYGSVFKAFQALKLPISQHQRFRKALKLAKGGKLPYTYEGKRYDFALSKRAE